MGDKKAAATRQTIVKAVWKNRNIKIRQTDVDRIVTDVFKAIVDSAKANGSVKLKEFGTFSVVCRKSRAYHTPTGQSGCTDDTNKLVFFPSEKVIEMLNDNVEE